MQPPPKSSLELEQEHLRPARRPQKRQIYVDAAVDDPFFVCTGESLKSLVKYFTRNSQCEVCGGDYQLSGLSLSKQGHVCRLEMPCVCDDSVVWLSSGLLGHPAKYVANIWQVKRINLPIVKHKQHDCLPLIDWYRNLDHILTL